MGRLLIVSDTGGLVDMGRVSDETTCVDGEIVAAGS